MVQHAPNGLRGVHRVPAARRGAGAPAVGGPGAGVGGRAQSGAVHADGADPAGGRDQRGGHRVCEPRGLYAHDRVQRGLSARERPLGLAAAVHDHRPLVGDHPNVRARGPEGLLAVLGGRVAVLAGPAQDPTEAGQSGRGHQQTGPGPAPPKLHRRRHRERERRLPRGQEVVPAAFYGDHPAPDLNPALHLREVGDDHPALLGHHIRRARGH
mmetsp:Transcript_97458/g.163833  ORF Transcript_97458/g.163833 Transcript_97458/m.163833 type:complete len:212 (-) Transcript_97458:504-1139(-)